MIASSAILETIQSPADLKRLSTVELAKLAGEIRDELVSSVTKTGGHLSSNLGVVELTIGLHTVFDSPRDIMIWDVGHQAYVHKLLTGRKDAFHTMRQQHGLAPFCAREESPHDAFGAGHAGTSLSAALGMAVARDMRGEDHHVIAVIGDGAMTCGMPFEAMNNAGTYGKRLIVILNDNDMSISPNVGALSRYLSRRRANPDYARRATDQYYMLAKIAPDGTVNGFVMPTMWEELGFIYTGPVDGHDLPSVIEA